MKYIFKLFSIIIFSTYLISCTATTISESSIETSEKSVGETANETVDTILDVTNQMNIHPIVNEATNLIINLKSIFMSKKQKADSNAHSDLNLPVSDTQNIIVEE